MRERFDEWRHRHITHGFGGPPASRQDGRGGFGVEALTLPFGACPTCDSDRRLASEPIDGGTLRLSLLCSGCGDRTEI